MLRLVIKIKLKKGFIKITLLDSYNFLSNILEKLCEDFEVQNQKGVFPYSFVNENTLNYIGVTPPAHERAIKYYNNIKTKEYKDKLYKKRLIFKIRVFRLS